jgi:ribonuclease P protein component
VSRQFTLGRKERLKSRKLIEQLFSEGRSFPLTPFRVYFLIYKTRNIQSSIFKLQFGAGVSTKNFKKAVDRNRIKRVTREAFRLQKTPLHEKLKEKNLEMNLFFIYTAKELPEFNIVKEKVELILNKLIQIVDENNSSNS